MRNDGKFHAGNAQPRENRPIAVVILGSLHVRWWDFLPRHHAAGSRFHLLNERRRPRPGQHKRQSRRRRWRRPRYPPSGEKAAHPDLSNLQRLVEHRDQSGVRERLRAAVPVGLRPRHHHRRHLQPRRRLRHPHLRPARARYHAHQTVHRGRDQPR